VGVGGEKVEARGDEQEWRRSGSGECLNGSLRIQQWGGLLLAGSGEAAGGWSVGACGRVRLRWSDCLCCLSVWWLA